MAKLATEHEKVRCRTKNLGEYSLRVTRTGLILEQEKDDGSVDRFKVDLTSEEIAEVHRRLI